MKYAIIKYRHLLLILLLIIVLMQPNICISAKTKTYVWNDITKPFVIEGGHKMKNGDLVVKINLTPEIIGSAKKIKLFIDYSGFYSGGKSGFCHIRINDNKLKIMENSNLWSFTE